MTDDLVSASSCGFTSKMRKRLKSISMNSRNIPRTIIYAKESTSLWRKLDPLCESRSNADMKELTMTLKEECCWQSERYDPFKLFSMTGVQNLTRRDTKYGYW
jgi:hypothetical protein